MNPARARLVGAALLLAVAASTGCAGEVPGPPPVLTSTSPTTTSPTTTSAADEAGLVTFEVVGPPGVVATIDWGTAPTASHTTHALPWRQSEVAPLTAFSVTLQAALPPEEVGLVSCRITVEGREVISSAEPRAVLCAAMNLTRFTKTARP